MTKRFETVFATTLEDAQLYYKENEPKGEYVLVLEGQSRKCRQQEEQAEWKILSIEEHMKIYEDQGMERKAAMKRVASDRGISKRDVYQALL